MRETSLKKRRILQERSTRQQHAFQNGSIEGLAANGCRSILEEGDNIQCGLVDMRLEEMKESNGNWKILDSSGDCNENQFLCGIDPCRL